MTFQKNKLMTISIITMTAILIGVLASPQAVTADDDGDDGKGSSVHHVIQMSAVEMPDDVFAYRMDSHIIDGNDVTEQRYGESSKASVPGPTIVIDEGDTVELTLTNLVSCENYPDKVNGSSETPSINHISIHVHGVHYDKFSDGTPKLINKITNEGASCDGGTYTYEWDAAKGSAGSWPYHDHTFLRGQGGEDVGLFGTLIVNEKRFDSFIDGKFKSIKTSDIDKEYVLWMVSTETLGRNIFYGMEIDNNNGGKQTQLWVNPVLVAEEDSIVRWHIMGMGDEFHSFHLHAHKWVEPGSTHVIDVEEIAPLDKHVFAIRAGEGVGPGDWMYHCHVFSHMEQGMSSLFRVLPKGTSDTLPDVGAVFAISDEPGLWFKTLNAGLIDALDPREGTGFPLDFLPGMSGSEGRSLAVIEPGQTVLFSMKDSETKHTVTSLIWPEDATINGDPFPFDSQLPVRGSTFIQDSDLVPSTLDTPGLYVFVCQIHPYMFSAVVVDDPSTEGFDIGEDVTILTRVGNDFPVTVPTLDPLPPGTNIPLALVQTFFVVTDPANWKDYTQSDWNVRLPPVPVTNGTLVVTLDALNVSVPNIQSELFNPSSGVGEVWINTQFERTTNKNDLGSENDKPGTITVLDTNDWSIERKIGLPDITMNHPHNMWADNKQSEVYQTQWFDKRMVTIDRESGEMIKDVVVGESPSHVMTNPLTGNVYIAMNGEEQVTEIDPNTLEITKQISTGTNTHPHGHWIGTTNEGTFIVTPNFFTSTSSIIDLGDNTITEVSTGAAPIATGMTPDGEFYYTADFLGNSFTKIETETGSVVDTIDLLPSGTGLPIQTPVSPDGKYMVTANVLFSKITVLDTATDSVVSVLPCDPGCHGVQWGAKDGGGYYAYVSNKFSNALIIVDPKSGSDAAIVGKILLAKEFGTKIDDKIIDHPGMGGQGVLTVPNVYNGWIQETVSECGLSTEDPCSQEVVDFLKDLTADQRDPS